MKIKNAPYITGTQINYYFVCKRKLWLFSHNISMGHTSGLVEIGSIIHKNTYIRKEMELDGIKIDFFEKNRGIINEVKKSKAVEQAHIWQLKYYLYHFNKLGIKVKGQIDYSLIRRREQIKPQRQFRNL
ncbi:MAG: CRISPR-associated protein Cas4 [Deltaproteobacteria bacterium]|nr:CRISPR-associated protein Cas4 [Deltaproteobacteria bacterium]